MLSPGAVTYEESPHGVDVHTGCFRVSQPTPRELKAVRRGAAANASVVVLNTTAGEAEIDAEDAAAREMRHALRAEAGRAAAQAEAARACARLERGRSKSAGRQGGHATARTEEI